MKTRIPKAILMAMGIALVCGYSCMKGEESYTQKIGLALQSTSTTWGKTVMTTAVKQAVTLKQPYFLANADSAAQQTKQLVAMAYPTLQLEACKAIVLSDLGVPVDSVNKYIAAGIGIILFNCNMPVDYACRVSGDNTAAGKLAGDYIKARLTDPAKDTVLMVRLNNSPAYVARAEACKKQLEGYPIVEEQVKTLSKAEGKRIIENAIKNNHHYAAIYAADDDVALEMLQTLESAQNTTTKAIVGCGGTQAFLDQIRTITNRDLATTLYPPESIVQCVDMASELARNGTPPAQKEIVVKMPLVDRTTVNNYTGIPK